MSAAPMVRFASEAEFQDAVVEYAQLLGWIVHHARPGQTRDGSWRTAVKYDGAGHPDLTMVRPGDRVIFAELKTDRARSRVSADQERWLEALSSIPGDGVECFLWSPRDWPQIERTLQIRRAA